MFSELITSVLVCMFVWGTI